MEETGITITTDVSDDLFDTKFRLDRLQKVVSIYNSKTETRIIEKLNDHKGILSVYWRKNLTEKEEALIDKHKLIIESAWESFNEDRVVYNSDGCFVLIKKTPRIVRRV